MVNKPSKDSKMFWRLSIPFLHFQVQHTPGDQQAGQREEVREGEKWMTAKEIYSLPWLSSDTVAQIYKQTNEIK